MIGGGLCFACPKVYFSSSNSAIVTLPGGNKEYYTWKIVEDQLSLKSIDENLENALFFEAEYEMNFLEKDDYTELVLLVDGQELFTLRK